MSASHFLSGHSLTVNTTRVPHGNTYACTVKNYDIWHWTTWKVPLTGN